MYLDEIYGSEDFSQYAADRDRHQEGVAELCRRNPKYDRLTEAVDYCLERGFFALAGRLEEQLNDIVAGAEQDAMDAREERRCPLTFRGLRRSDFVA